MQRFDSVTRELPVAYEQAFGFIAEPKNLPKWALAFRAADEQSALIVQASRDVPVRIASRTVSSRESGVIDWHMAMPDGSEIRALSRLVDLLNGNCVYTFLFFARPVADADIAGTLAGQKRAVEQEFDNLIAQLGGVGDESCS